jgi:magnesium-protoporphyrin O-methyltransferase
VAKDCCTIDYDEHFNAEDARRDVLEYRAHGPDGSTRRLLDALIAQGATSGTLLDIGGGVGVIQLELLEAGMTSSLDVDASAPFIAAARAEAEERGLGDRTSYRHGDFVALADSVEPADVVTLDRVICCYPDAVRLVSRSAERARRLYGLVYPVNRWPLRLAAWLINLTRRRDDFRMYVHEDQLVDRLARDAGLEQRYRHAGWIWQTVVYARVSPSTAATAAAS